MNKNISKDYETSSTSLMLKSSHATIDMTEINDCDECEKTSLPITVPSNVVCPLPPRRPAKKRRLRSAKCFEDSRRKEQSESEDDSVCILYENVQPSPEILFANEVAINGQKQSQSADIVSKSISEHAVIPPIVIGSNATNPTVQISLLYPNFSSYKKSPAYRQSIKNLRETPKDSSLPFSRNASVINWLNSLPQTITQQNSLSETQAQLNRSTKIPKIQCGICLGGSVEIAVSNRNFTSTICGHIFCNTCIETYLRKAAKCPNCRKRITAKSIHPLYF